MPNERVMVEDTQDAFGSGEMLGDLMRNLPVAVYTTDAAGFVTSFNPAAAALAGRLPQVGRDRWCVTWRLYWPDGRPMPHHDCPMAVTLRENRAIRGAEAIAERPDGTRFTMKPYPTPVRGPAGEVLAGVNVLVDVSDQGGTSRLKRALGAELDQNLHAVFSVVDAILATARDGVHGHEARAVLTLAIQQVAALRVVQGLLRDAAGDRPINSWDLLSAACMSMRVSLPQTVELQCESTAGDVPVEIALPLALIAKELIAGFAAVAVARQGSRVVINIGLRKERSEFILSVGCNGTDFSVPPEQQHRLPGLVATLVQRLNGICEMETGSKTCCNVRFPDYRTLH